MRLSELKQLNPIAYDVFLEEMKNQNKEEDFNTLLESDAPLGESIFFRLSKIDTEIWQQIYFEQNFTLFNEWLKNNNQ